MIDRLDPTINKIPYHHEGPYDAASFARNNDPKNSPVAALQESNREALKATAPENIKDSLSKHKPLDGVALVPPGEPDKLGRRLDYEEGENEMLEGRPDGGAYKRYAGVVSYTSPRGQAWYANRACRTMQTTTSEVKASHHTASTVRSRTTPSTNVSLMATAESNYQTVHLCLVTTTAKTASLSMLAILSRLLAMTEDMRICSTPRMLMHTPLGSTAASRRA